MSSRKLNVLAALDRAEIFADVVTVLLRPDLHAMLRVMRIFTGANLHKPASRVMVKSDLHSVSVRRCVAAVYYL